jgi:hypothetical protein
MTTINAYNDIISRITTNGKRTTCCLAATTLISLYGLETVNELEDAELIQYAGQNSNNLAVYIIA